ncbi:S8 family serine peptidase [Dokdonia sp. Hel_I_53]|uniref:S8 family serine peptidase n=1 Tax=Dokdonia sp. Hel_I_53 TaxID=1566287 RepID=UPI00119BE83E|nr:S8 family serine peptidase [Dokdonia sp. Hel_I_53]TVZ51765.1 putative secreted protein (Por secretion system target) [Dokdonia sp. Hel_I_53]
MKNLLPLFLFLCTLNLISQEDAWVFLNDKENVSEALASPITILTQKAIDRKEMHNVAIDERDVPVNEHYISQIKSQDGITVLAKSKWMNCLHVRGSQAAIESLADLSFVSSIDFADNSLNTNSSTFQFIKEDPVAEQTRAEFTYGSTENQVTMLNVQALHQQDYTGEGMTIAVMDSGFPGVDQIGGFARLRNAGKLLNGYDFVDREENEFLFRGNNHGTKVLSDIVGFITDQFVGTAPDAAVYCFRTEDTANENPVEESYWVEAAERADSLGVDVINTSLGYRTFDNPAYDYTYEDMDGETAFISRGATLAFEKGMLVVTSSGNSGSDRISAPADARGSFTVGAVDSNGNYASFSSIGPTSDGRVKPDVMAKGQGSAVIDENNIIRTNNGTSFSSPIMAGAVASFWQANRERTNEAVIQVIRENSSIFNNPNPRFGYGIPDFEAALPQILNTTDYAFAKAYQVYPNPTSQDATLVLPENVENAEIFIYDLLGKQVKNYKTTKKISTLPTSQLKSGVYILQIKSNKSLFTQKLIKS